MTQVVFRTTRFFRWWIFGATILFAAGWFHFWRSEGMGTWTWCFTLLALLALLGLIDSLRRRIALMPDGIEIRSGFRQRFLPRVEILAVTWEGGSGVALKLRDGRWFKLPETGHNSQALSNHIRTWLQARETRRPG